MEKLIKHKEKIILFFILLAAAFLRLYKIDQYMTFLGDEGRDVLVVYNLLHGTPTLLGPTASVGGFFLGPIYYYFMAPFLWIFNYNPVGPAVMVALFGIATVWLVYKVGKDFFNPLTGIIASLLYAISPLVVGYSRSSWNPNLMPFFSLLSLYVLYHAVSDRRKFLLFSLCGFLLGIAIQLHYLTVFLFVIVGIYILLNNIFSCHCEGRTERSEGARLLDRGERRGNLPNKCEVHDKIEITKNAIKTVQQYVFIGLGFLIGLIPFLAFEVRHGFPNIQSILKFVFSSGDTGGNANFFLTIGDVYFRLFARLVTAYPPQDQINAGMHANIGIWHFVTFVLAVGSVVLLLTQLYKAKDRSKINKMILLVVWLMFGILLFGFYKKSIYDYYFGFLFPLPFLLVGNALAFLVQRKEKVLKSISLLIFVWLVWLNLSGVSFRSTPNRQLDQVKGIAQFVLKKTDGKPYNFALMAAANSDHGYRYFFKLAGKDPVVIQNQQLDPKRTSVTNQLLVVCEMPDCHPLGTGLWEIAGFGRAEIAGRWPVSVVEVLKLVHYKQTANNK